ncbi:MAG: uroporphyrinogen-III synthase [Alphaproteobacteria bacterium]|nr:uroporphyrinogen-III synthase [Alphaproteobacteria bacterium]MDX5417207.1 uroporphyrinogen-III synthase [Alphaproteobacteria bacterium]MDX5494646.1 uroporphyrinogen-III synthase [Alphaproteobacteria bacterium]
MRLLVTRPERESKALAAELEARGHEVTIAPLLSIRYLDDVSLPQRGWQALLVTSANGARALGRLADAALKKVPVLAVGEASAAAARAEGFSDVRAAEGDVHALDALAARVLYPAGGPLFHAAGSVLAGDLKAMLAARGFEVERLALYEAEKQGLPQHVLDALKGGTIDGVLFFSPRTAGQFAALTRQAGISSSLGGVTAYCLSAAVAGEIAGLAFGAVHVAAEPTLKSLTALISA